MYNKAKVLEYRKKRPDPAKGKTPKDVLALGQTILQDTDYLEQLFEERWSFIKNACTREDFGSEGEPQISPSEEVPIEALENDDTIILEDDGLLVKETASGVPYHTVSYRSSLSHHIPLASVSLPLAFFFAFPASALPASLPSPLLLPLPSLSGTDPFFLATFAIFRTQYFSQAFR